MVNTFLVDPDFRVSAQKLDRSRLGKQRVEAYQILLVIQQYRFLAHHFGIPDFPVGVDTPKELRSSWVDQVTSRFKSSGLDGIFIRGEMIIEYPKGSTLPFRIASGNTFQIDPSTGLLYEMKGARRQVVRVAHWSDYVLPGDDLITTRIRKHPAILMWLGFEEALKDYINSTIEAWVARGYKNTMKTYQVTPGYPRPAWCNQKEIWENFQSALVQKELDRNEPTWYLNQPDFVRSWLHSKENLELIPRLHRERIITLGSFPGYIWP